MLGALLTGVFATAVNDLGRSRQIINQLVAIGAATALAAIGTLVLLFIVDKTVGMRVKDSEEIEGLDLTQHGEAGYHL